MLDFSNILNKHFFMFDTFLWPKIDGPNYVWKCRIAWKKNTGTFLRGFAPQGIDLFYVRHFGWTVNIFTVHCFIRKSHIHEKFTSFVYEKHMLIAKLNWISTSGEKKTKFVWH